MSRPPSLATQVKSLKKRLSTAQNEVLRVNKMVSILESSSNEYRGRATKAEQEAAEWKRRFDELLFQRGQTP